MRKSFFLFSMIVHCLFLLLLVNVKPEFGQKDMLNVTDVEIIPAEKLYLPVIKQVPKVTAPKTRRRRVVVKPFKMESPDGKGDKRALKGSEGLNTEIPKRSENLKNLAGNYEKEEKREEVVKEKPEKKKSELLFNDEIARSVIKKEINIKKKNESGGNDGVQFSGNKGFFSKEGDGISAYGGAAFLNLDGYDITPWARRTVYRIKMNWFPPEAVKLGVTGKVTIYVAIEPNGRISDIRLHKSSGVEAYDRAALAALTSSVPFMQLPADFPNPNLQVLFVFQYQ